MSNENSLPQICLYDLPTNILQFICQLLINNRRFSKHVGDFRILLNDVMNLRATCVSLCDVTMQMFLYLPCEISPDWLISPRNKNLNNFLDFIKRKTSWRFYTLKFEKILLRTEFDVMALLHRNEKLFYRSIIKVMLEVPQYNCSSVNNLIQWLKRVALKQNSKIEVQFENSVSVITEPSLVSKLVLAGNKSPKIRNIGENIFRNISLYSNLRELVLESMKFGLENLEFFPFLSLLSVGDLEYSKFENGQKMPFFPNIKIVAIHNSNKVNGDTLNRVINESFPYLENFEFDNYFENDHVLFSRLPSSCYILNTTSCLLPNFINCKQIKYLSLDDHSPIIVASDCIDGLGELGKMQISVLKIKFWCDFRLLSEVMEIVINIITNAKHLEALSIDSSKIIDGDLFRHSTITVENDIAKLFEGDKNFDSIEFLRQQVEMRKRCSESNIQIIILGSTVLAKKSASSVLFSRLNELESKYGWEIRPPNAVFLPLELPSDLSC